MTPQRRLSELNAADQSPRVVGGLRKRKCCDDTVGWTLTSMVVTIHDR
jgi:hypothetical protein